MNGGLKTQLTPQVSHAHPRRLTYLDGWRGLSIAVVLAGHFTGGAFADSARLGVEMFFVLSGRLMAEILFVEGSPLPEFYRRRFSRVWPALIAFVAIVFVALHRTHMAFGLKAAIASLTTLYGYLGASGVRAQALDHIWSLCVEEHAYIALGVLALASRTIRLPVLPVLICAAALSMVDGAISTLVLHQSLYVAYWRSDAHIAPVFLSAALFLILRDRRLPSSLCWASGLAGVAVFVLPVPIAVRCSLGTSLLALSVNALGSVGPSMQRALSSRPLAALGLISFSLYLWQQPFYAWTMQSGPLIRLAALAGAVACAVASFYAVERPARRWLNGLGVRHQAERTGTAKIAT